MEIIKSVTLSMDIPKYPEFKNLEREDKPVFDSAFRKFPPVISEFTFTNLYSWRKVYQYHICVYNGFLLIRSDTPKPGRFLEPIGGVDKIRAIQQIFSDKGIEFIRVSEETAGLCEKDGRFTMREDKDNSDYLYLAQGLIDLKGRKFDGKRNLIRQFQSNYKYEYIAFDKTNIAHCLDFEEKWCTIKDCQSIEGLNNERSAIRQMVENFSGFNLIAGGIRIGGEISAVAIAEELNPDTLVMHVFKADPDKKGLHQAFMHEFLGRNAKALRYVNLEQDLGVAGLRKSKLSYEPVAMVRKYTISLSSDRSL